MGKTGSTISQQKQETDFRKPENTENTKNCESFNFSTKNCSKEILTKIPQHTAQMNTFLSAIAKKLAFSRFL